MKEISVLRVTALKLVTAVVIEPEPATRTPTMAGSPSPIRSVPLGSRGGKLGLILVPMMSDRTRIPDTLTLCCTPFTIVPQTVSLRFWMDSEIRSPRTSEIAETLTSGGARLTLITVPSSFGVTMPITTVGIVAR